MATVLVLYDFSHGHVEKLAHKIAASAREAVASADVKHVLELLSLEAAKAVNYNLIRPLQPRALTNLVEYDPIVAGTGTPFGGISPNVASLLDQKVAYGPKGRPPWQGRWRLHRRRRSTSAGDDAVYHHHQAAQPQCDGVFASQMKVDERTSLPAPGARGAPSRRPPRSFTAHRRDRNAVVPGRVDLAVERKGS